MHTWQVVVPLCLVFVSTSLAASLRQNYLENHNGCHCMAYWSCITSGGTARSYCGLSESIVCCLVPANAAPIGILPRSGRSDASKTCGRKGAHGHTKGLATMFEWPWHTAILTTFNDTYVCGGSLLDERWVLTAAHCVDEFLPQYNGTQLKVRLGEYDVHSTAEPLRHEEHLIRRLIMHPGFDDPTLANDIALLELSSPARRSQNIDAVCMPKAGDFQNRRKARCYVTGWGKTSENSNHSSVLKEIAVPLWSNPACQSALRRQFGPGYTLPGTAICAGAEGRDACDGDGGGPMVCEKEGHWYQVGVVSFGVGCGKKNVPGVYTRVQAYDRWIRDTVAGANIITVDAT